MSDTSTAEERDLEKGEWKTLAVLGIPSLALALATTVVTTYLPVHLQTGKTSTAMIGLLIGTEGVMAIIVPLIVGTWSDTLRTRFGGRLPFVMAGTLPVGIALALMGFTRTLGIAAILLFVFYAGYFTAYEPYRALYPDLIDEAIAGRAQSTQSIARGLGTFLALVGGGLLIALASPAPFVTAAAVSTGALAAFAFVAQRRRRRREAEQDGEQNGDESDGRSVGEQVHHLWCMVRDRGELQEFLAANALWELTLGALKTFVVLYLTIGLGFQQGTASGIIGGVALLLLVGSPISGKLGDRFGRLRVMNWTLVVYGLGFFVPFLTTSHVLIVAAVPFIALGGGVVMTLPYAILQPLMGDAEHGALTGYYSVSRGIGTALGPILAGTAIAASDSFFDGTKGYQAMWGVCGAAILMSLIPLRRLRNRVGDHVENGRGED